MEDRLIDIESRLAFQEHTLQALNDVIARQQQEIDHLTRQLQHAQEQLRNLATTLPTGPQDEPPPPHY